ncbi:MAG: hypothetical protein J3Q66DRAFT_330482 [Benniella sp.]|nr:MAG: hypothetical protein J3Q66DRAFT_330482 [Benniella sp.]
MQSATSPPSYPPSSAVFDIYFLQAQICAELTQRDIRHCCLVSKDFYHNLSPFLYRSIHIHRSSTFKKFIRPESLAALERNREHVLHVSSVYARVWKYLVQCRCFHLVVLQSPSLPRRPQNRETNKQELPHILTLMQSCPQLRVLELGHFNYEEEKVNQFCTVVRAHGQLREVMIDHYDHVRSHIVETILWSMLRMERFSINVYTSDARQRQDSVTESKKLIALTGVENPVFALKELVLPCTIYDYELALLFPFMPRCPHIERFTMPYICGSRATRDLILLLATFAPHLQHLDMRTCGASGFDVALAIAACQNLRSFKAGPATPPDSKEIFDALMLHQDTLEELNVEGCFAISSAQLNGFLSRLPKLQVLEAMSPLSKICKTMEVSTREKLGDPILSMDDLRAETRRPWICHQLRVLKLRYAGREKLENAGNHDDDDDDEDEDDDDDDDDDDLDDDTHSKRYHINRKRKKKKSEEDGVEEVFPSVLLEQLTRLTELEVLWLGRIERYFLVVDPIAIADRIASGDNADTTTMGSPSIITSATDLNAVVQRENRRAIRHQALTQNMGHALAEMSKLHHLRQLELRNLRPFIKRADIKQAKKNWKHLKKLNYS